MYFPADKVYAACRGNLDDAKFFAIVQRELLDGTRHDKDYPALVKS